MASMEERASILSPGSDIEAGDALRARAWAPPARRGVLAGCVLLAAAGAVAWGTTRGERGQAAARPAAAEAAAFLAESKGKEQEAQKKAKAKAKPVDEKIKAQLADDLSKAKQQEEDTRAKAQADADDAEAAEEEANETREEARKHQAQGEEKVAGAANDTKKAGEMRTEAKKNITTANGMAKEATSSASAASAKLAVAKPDLAKAKKALGEAKGMVRSADEQMDAAKAVEVKSLETAAAARACVDLPGVRLADAPGGAKDFAPMLADKETGTSEQCAGWCQKHEGCAQAVFSADDSSCKLFEKTTTDVTVFAEGFNSSFCAVLDDKENLDSLLEKAYSHQPYIPPLVECSWDGEDCTGSKCCNDEDCDWEFLDCKSYSCFGSGEQATCMSACYGDQCENQGTGRETREIEKAKEGVLLQGTSLYCFMAVVWSTKEGALADNAKDKGASVYLCDESDVFEGQETDQTEWKTYLNADMFIDVWKQVQKSGKYTTHDWTVKVEADTVFFPDILKQHLEQLRTPQGSRVYLKNMEYKYQFLGPLEVLSQQAVTLFFEKGWVCEQKEHGKQAEDYYLKHCLDAIGADHQTDFELLQDRVADKESTKLDCTSGWTAAFHWARSVDDWNSCYDSALKAQAKGRTLWEAAH